MSIPTVDIKGISVRQASDELHIVAGRDPGYICKKSDAYDDTRRNPIDRPVLPGAQDELSGTS